MKPRPASRWYVLTQTTDQSCIHKQFIESSSVSGVEPLRAAVRHLAHFGTHWPLSPTSPDTHTRSNPSKQRNNGESLES